MTKLIVVGALAGQTFKFRQFRFVDGQIEIPGDVAQNEGVIKYLGKNCQAFPAGHPRLEALNHGKRDIQTTAWSGQDPEVPGAGESNGGKPPETPAADLGTDGDSQTGDKGIHPEGNGHQNTGLDSIQEKVSAAALKLDHENDEHWNQAGKPMVAVMQQLTGLPALTRKDLDIYLPGLIRQPKAE